MKTNTDLKILEFIKQNEQVTVQDLIMHLGHSAQAIHRQLKKLLENKQIQKIGSAPRVYYQIFDDVLVVNSIDLKGLKNNRTHIQEIDQGTTQSTNQDIDNQLKNIIDNQLIDSRFVEILPNGVEISGISAFVYWCQQRNFDLVEYAKKYTEICARYDFYKNKMGIIDATAKLKSTYQNQVFLEKLFYLDFSAIEIFGKTKAYTYLLYSKLNENRKMMYQIFKDLDVYHKIRQIIQLFEIQAVAFVPPTVPRKIQIQKELERFLAINLPKIEITKIQTPILVPQKTLSNPKDRIINSQTTFVVPKAHNYRQILLIDDFTGSGATLNFVAQKILNKFTNPQNQLIQNQIDSNPDSKTNQTKVYGLTLCGTPNGLVNNSQKFEIVKEI